MHDSICICCLNGSTQYLCNYCYCQVVIGSLPINFRQIQMLFQENKKMIVLSFSLRSSDWKPLGNFIRNSAREQWLSWRKSIQFNIFSSKSSMFYQSTLNCLILRNLSKCEIEKKLRVRCESFVSDNKLFVLILNNTWCANLLWRNNSRNQDYCVVHDSN